MLSPAPAFAINSQECAPGPDGSIGTTLSEGRDGAPYSCTRTDGTTTCSLGCKIVPAQGPEYYRYYSCIMLNGSTGSTDEPLPTTHVGASTACPVSDLIDCQPHAVADQNVWAGVCLGEN
eukprot:COSAG02_NODE_559_length_20335_cov_10.631894_8_plen_120_part_00